MGWRQRCRRQRLASEDPGWFQGTGSSAQVCGWHLRVTVHLPLCSHFLRLGKPPTLELVCPSVGAVTANINNEFLNNSLHTLRSYFSTWKNSFKKKKSLTAIKLGLVCKMWRLAPPRVLHSFFKLEKGMKKTTKAIQVGLWISSTVALVVKTTRALRASVLPKKSTAGARELRSLTSL